MESPLARALMDDFADDTGLSGKSAQRRYLWTDSFAVCNFLGLFRQTGEDRYLNLARELVFQVHHVLGQYRADDSRHGWISGLPQETAEEHPTSGGLRIGKKLSERAPDEPLDNRLEWDRDGQYYHYLTKWMHALCRMAGETGESCYQRWAAELALTAHQAFTRELFPGGPKWIVWKLSVDLTRPLVSSAGQHDPLDGLITSLEIQTARKSPTNAYPDLAAAIQDMTEMCAHAHWATEDPLGIGGLLDDATRLAKLVFIRHVEHQELLHKLLIEAERSLHEFASGSLLYQPAEHRLAFRELGLSIGLHGLQSIDNLVAQDQNLVGIVASLQEYQFFGDQIRSFWSDPKHRLSDAWTEHRDINTVMLATSLAPESYLQL